MIGLAITTSALLALPAEVCGPDRDGYCTSKVVHHALAYSDAAQRLQINTALGDVVSLEFPRGVALRGEPALGNKAIFDFRAQAEPFRILVWPKLPAGAQGVTAEDLAGERSNLQVFLDSGVAVLVDLKISAPEQAVQRVVFEFPARARESEWVEEQVAERMRRAQLGLEEQKADLEAEVESRAERLVAKGMLARLQCEELRARGMSDLFVVWARRICRIGDHVFIELSLKNRAKNLFHLGAVEVVPEGEEEGAVVAHQAEWSAETTLAFNQEVRGVVVFRVEDDTAKAYVVTVRESGGEKRAIVVDGVAF